MTGRSLAFQKLLDFILACIYSLFIKDLYGRMILAYLLASCFYYTDGWLALTHPYCDNP